MRQASKLPIRKNHRDSGGWLVLIGAGFAGLQFGVWTHHQAWDLVNWPINGRTIYWSLILVAIVLGSVDCLRDSFASLP